MSTLFSKIIIFIFKSDVFSATNTRTSIQIALKGAGAAPNELWGIRQHIGLPISNKWSYGAVYSLFLDRRGKKKDLPQRTGQKVKL